MEVLSEALASWRKLAEVLKNLTEVLADYRLGIGKSKKNRLICSQRIYKKKLADYQLAD